MATFQVFEPPARSVDARPRADRVAFVRDGFTWSAFLFGPLWMLRHRAWLVVVCWVLVVSALEVLFRTFGTSPSARGLVMVLLSVLVGLEAATLRRWTYLRAGWRDHGIVVADDRDAAEQRFFATWEAEHDGGRRTSTPTPAEPAALAPLPTFSPGKPLSPGQPFSPGQPLGVIGLFPRGGPR